MQFEEWWDKYHFNYYQDRPSWRVKEIARQAWQDATHAEFMKRMDRELERSKETE